MERYSKRHDIWRDIQRVIKRGMLQIANVQEQGVETLVLLQKLLLVLASCSGEVPGKEICKYMEMKYAEKYGEQHSSKN